VTIAGMTMADGLANGSSPVLASTGGAILNFGTLTLANDVLSNNQAIGDAGTSPLGKPGRALGGALANLGTGPLTISSSAFISNLALGADGSSNGNAVGGAFVNGMGSFATAVITDSLFAGNVAQAGSYDNGDRAAEGAGGALENTGALTVRGCTCTDNQAIGGNDSVSTIRPGLGVGGALISGGPAGPLATLVLKTSTFDHNQAIGGNGNQSSNPAPSVLGPNDAFGGGIHISGGKAAISDCTFEHNAAIAGVGSAGQNGGLAVGGGGDASNLFAPRLLSVVILVDLEGHAGVDAAQHADQPAVDAIALSDFARDVFLAMLGGVEVADLAAELPRLTQGGFFEAGGDLEAVGSEVLERDAVDPEVVL
jgi:hypothetical protein